MALTKKKEDRPNPREPRSMQRSQGTDTETVDASDARDRWELRFTLYGGGRRVLVYFRDGGGRTENVRVFHRAEAVSEFRGAPPMEEVEVHEALTAADGGSQRYETSLGTIRIPCGRLGRDRGPMEYIATVGECAYVWAPRDEPPPISVQWTGGWRPAHAMWSPPSVSASAQPFPRGRSAGGSARADGLAAVEAFGRG